MTALQHFKAGFYGVLLNPYLWVIMLLCIFIREMARTSCFTQ